MKALIIGNQDRYEKYRPEDMEFLRDLELVYCPRGSADEVLLAAGRIAGAGLDTVYPEPTTADNPIVDLPASCADKVIFSPHIGGITTSAFKRAHRLIWQSFADVSQGKRPQNIVNGL